mmetsp:Transcript_13690/g.58484  ORF Transcript_13690/g.58484 Transcript_13690/m.58484 type:complete len:1309 (+) Transcript_13690:1525-5451(+)
MRGLAREQRELLPGRVLAPRLAQLAVRRSELHARLAQRLQSPALPLLGEVLRVRAQVEHRQLVPVLGVHRALERLAPHGGARHLELLVVVLQRVRDNLEATRVLGGVHARRVERVVGVGNHQRRGGVAEHHRSERVPRRRAAVVVVVAVNAGDSVDAQQLGSRLHRAPVPGADRRDERARLARAEPAHVAQAELAPGVRDGGVDVDADLVHDVHQRALEHARLLLLRQAVLQGRERHGPSLAAGGELRDHARRVAHVAPERHRVAHRVRVLDKLRAQSRALPRERRHDVIHEVHFDGVHFLRDSARVVLHDAPDHHRDGLLEQARVVPRRRGRGDAHHVRAVLDHKLQQPVEVGLLARDGGAARLGRARRDVRALQKVHQLAVRVQHGERARRVARAPDRRQDAHVHGRVADVGVVLAHLRAPRRHGNAAPQRFAALASDVHARFALHGDGGFARERLNQVLPDAALDRLAPQRVPGVRQRRGLLEQVRGFGVGDNLIHHAIGQRDAKLDEPLTVRLERRRKLAPVEIAHRLLLQALYARQRVERVDRLRARGRRLRPDARLAPHHAAEPRAHARLGGDLGGGDVRQSLEHVLRRLVPCLRADVHRSRLLRGHVRHRALLLAAAVAHEPLGERLGRCAVQGEQVAQALLDVVRVLRAVERAQRALRRLGVAARRRRRRLALGKRDQLLVEAQRELGVDVVQRLVRLGVRGRVRQRRGHGQVGVVRALALEQRRDGVDLRDHRLAAARHARVPLVPLQHLVQHVAAVHAALEHGAARVTRRRARVVPTPAQKRRDAVLEVLRDVGHLRALDVHHLQQVADRRDDGVGLLLGEHAPAGLLAVAHARLVVLVALVVVPAVQEQIAPERGQVAHAADAHHAVEDPRRHRLRVLGRAPRPRRELQALGPVLAPHGVVRRGEHLLAHDGGLEHALPLRGEAAAEPGGPLALPPPAGLRRRLLVANLGGDEVVLLLLLLFVLLVVALVRGSDVAPGEQLLQFAEVAEDVHGVLQLLAAHAGHGGLELASRLLALLALDEVGKLILRVGGFQVGVALVHGRGLGLGLLGRVRFGSVVVVVPEQVALDVTHGLGFLFLLPGRALLAIGGFLKALLLLLGAPEPRDLVVLEEVVIVLVQLQSLRLALLLLRRGVLLVVVVVGAERERVDDGRLRRLLFSTLVVAVRLLVVRRLVHVVGRDGPPVAQDEHVFAAIAQLESLDQRRVRDFARLHDVGGGGLDHRHDAPRAGDERVFPRLGENRVPRSGVSQHPRARYAAHQTGHVYVPGHRRQGRASPASCQRERHRAVVAGRGERDARV